eukprot:jgi/Tetstr1/420843/TSEL_011918.t1
MAYESKRPRKARARAAAAAAATSADAGGLRAGHGRRAAAGKPPPLPPAEPGGRAPRPATQLATVVSMADALPTEVLRLTVEGEELKAAATQHHETVEELRSRLSAAEISAEQSIPAACDARPKLYQDRYNIRKRKHGTDEEDCEAGDESGSESAEGGDNSGEEPRHRIRWNRRKGMHYKLRRAAPENYVVMPQQPHHLLLDTSDLAGGGGLREARPQN